MGVTRGIGMNPVEAPLASGDPSETDHGNVLGLDPAPVVLPPDNSYVENLGGHDLVAERYENNDYAAVEEPPEFVQANLAEQRRVAALDIARSINPPDVATLLSAARQVEAYMAGTPADAQNGAQGAVWDLPGGSGPTDG